MLGSLRGKTLLGAFRGRPPRDVAAADRCMQIHGGVGLATELPIETFWREQRSMMITEGPTEVLQMALARHVLQQFG